MKNRLFVAALAAPAAVTMALALSACGSSSQTIDGQGGNGSTAPTGSTNAGGSSSSAPTTSSPSTSSPSTSSSASPAVGLAARLGQGLSHARTAHLTLNVDAAGQSIVGGGDEQLSNGKLVALDLTETVSKSLALRLIIVGGKAYVRLPGSLNTSGKPWQLVTAKSSNSTVRTLASSLASTQNSASLSSVTAFVSAARSVKQTGTSGSSTTYAVDVDPSKLPGTYEGKQALVAAGINSIPIDMTIDSAGRPTLVTENLTVQGEKISTRITVGAYNKPVHITAPPASQISTR